MRHARARMGVVYKKVRAGVRRGWVTGVTAGWWWMVGWLAPPALGFRAPAQAKVQIPLPGRRLHPTGSGQARYVTDDDQFGRGGEYRLTINIQALLSCKGPRQEEC